MTLGELNNMIEEVRYEANINDDDERAHAKEDDLRAEFIKHVADTAGGTLSDMAFMVLSTDNIRFSRWYA